jgi:uncharacterized membrane protein YiaA
MEILQLLSSYRCQVANTNLPHSSSLYSLGTGRTENTVCNSSFIVTCGLVTVGTYLSAKALLSTNFYIYAYLAVFAQ